MESNPTKKDLRKYAADKARVSGLSFDKYVERVENMTRSVIEERPTNFQRNRCLFPTYYGSNHLPRDRIR